MLLTCNGNTGQPIYVHVKHLYFSNWRTFPSGDPTSSPIKMKFGTIGEQALTITAMVAKNILLLLGREKFGTESAVRLSKFEIFILFLYRFRREVKNFS